MLKRGWKYREKAVFLQRLGTCLKQGYPLAQAMELLGYHEGPVIRETVQFMVSELKKGLPLHEVISHQSFPKDVCGFIYFSEQHGDLALGLIEGGNMLEKREKSKAKLQQLLRYPFFLLWIVAILFFIMFKYLYPQFQALYASMDIELPLITRLLLSMNHYLLPCLSSLGGVFIILLVYSFIKYKNAHSVLPASFAKTPIVSQLIRLYFTYYLSLHLGSLLNVGMSINQAIQVFSNQTFMPFFQKEAERIILILKNGEALEVAFMKQPFYTQELAGVIAHGQMNGMLGKELFDYSQLLIQSLEEKLNHWFAVLQPLLLIFIGGFTLFLFLSILLPIFQMMSGL